MDSKQFTSVVTEQVQRSLDMLRDKNEHYNPEGDKLESFKKAAGLRGQTPRQALSGMMLKHTVSVYDLCDAENLASFDTWNEKITDHINYLLLLRAIVEEEGRELFDKCDQSEGSEDPQLAEIRERLTAPPTTASIAANIHSHVPNGYEHLRD